MAESDLHRFLKQASLEALQKDGFVTYLEPRWPPTEVLAWGRYRPDVLGLKNSPEMDVYAFVECETQPKPRRFLAKNTNSITIQTRLMKHTRVRLILTVPSDLIESLGSNIQKDWEVWAIEAKGGEVPSWV